MAEYLISIPAPGPWLNANQRHAHWSGRSGPTKLWREAAAAYARQARIPALARASVTAVVHRADRRRDCDAHNRYPTVKAVIDGVVDAGVLPDDSDRYLTALTIRAGAVVDKRRYPMGVLELIITEEALVRIRSIKPEYWRSDDIAALSISARLTFIGMWSYVDDNGVGSARLSSIVADLYAEDMARDSPETLRRVSGDLRELSEQGLILFYEAAGKQLLYVTRWTSHQLVNKPSKGHCYPLPPAEMIQRAESLPRPSGESPETPGYGAGEQGNRGAGEELTCAPQAERETPPALSLVPEPERAPEPGSDADPDWVKFWSIYPRKKSKDGARKSWKAALKKAPAEVIIAGAERYAAERAGQDPNFTAHPTKWLNQGCWADEPDPRRAATGTHRPYQDPDRAAYHQGSI